MLKKTKGFYDGLMDHAAAKSYVEENGRDAFLGYLQNEYPDYGLSGYSTSWEDDQQYICKARGAYGDVIIGWEDN